MIASARIVFFGAALTALLASPGLAQTNGIASPIQKISPQGAVTIPQAEVPSVGTLDPVQPHWVFVNRGNGLDGTRIFDGDTGKMKGMVNMYGQDSFSFDPLGKNFYVAQTIWSKLDRGTRQDMLLVYDVRSLKLVSEVPIPGRMLIGNRTHNLMITSDGKKALVYNMQPSSSVNVVDLDKRVFDKKIELPGCATMFTNTLGGFSALCSNGTLATVAMDGPTPSITRSAPFFSATEDPIFDTSIIDPKTGNVTMLSYSGLITPVALGPAPRIGAPWSIQQAAFMRKATYTPMDVNWMPGGRQPMAVHFASGRIYVLMHMGEYWSEYEPAQEIWVLDANSHKLIGRHALPDGLRDKLVNIAVSQDARPQVYASDGSGNTHVLDAQTLQKIRSMDNSGGGILYTVEP
ncbi:MAG TPA: amine dehydrogenase large subunit [Rhizomicrobium sp.]|nr:amine dehydrogenase large subunit [Rhizomicrobium sp.]